jgi:hypothetical protein
VATIQSLHCNYSESESKEHKMTNLEVVLKKELSTCLHPSQIAHLHHHAQTQLVNTWFVAQMIVFGVSTQTTRPKEGRWWWGSHAEMLRISPHQLGSSDAQRKQHPSHNHSTSPTRHQLALRRITAAT